MTIADLRVERWISVLAVAALVACGDYGDFGPGGEVGTSGGAGPSGGVGGSSAAPGVTPGGVQDIEYARQLVDDGIVPPAEAITVEGLLSQHDLPTVGEPCTDLMCLRPAIAVAPSLETGERAYWLHLGMTSGLTDFRRPPLDLTIVIDRSASMVGDMVETNEAAIDMLRQLRPDDRASVIAFNQDVDVVFAHGPVVDLAAVSADVRAIHATGDWQIDAALGAALELQRAAGDSPDRMRRVVVLSCGYPDSSASGAFARLAGEAAAERIGFTFVGILLGFDPSLGDLLGQTRGGSYYYVQDLAAIETFFDEELDFMMSPLAYDLSIRLDLGAGFAFDRAFGIPADAAGLPRAEIDVATAFLSRRRGGIVVRLRETGEFDQELGTAALGYEPETAHGWEGVHDESVALTLPETISEVHWGSDGARKAVALVNAAERMRTACARYHAGARGEAADIMAALIEHLRGEADALADDGLRSELAFAEALAALL